MNSGAPFLSRLPLFADVSPETLARLEHRMRRRACGGKGVRGRVGVYEVMKVTPRLRAMIGSASRSEEIHAAAVEEGMIDLQRYSAWLLTEGLEEVTSVVSVDI